MKAKRKPIAPIVLTKPVDLEAQKGKSPTELRSGDICPQCKEGRLDYDGLLNLSCPVCGYSLGGCFT